ncbi:UDP-N-acetylmuramate dehydrogenase [Anaerosphaera multitolerans]|uniref:UDP-N-acetylenolpyruvoylglucosamine reductase n=1 Tax=Anaerosphaera multitolerans TaxID=2487351 RepID=A0A437S6G2_9FIRM|nr:UDP-N-acetylmuramate dehydrogenase [Anaerosphaera multitolerans]RVU54596.1 UDP-N-acetylmuramate dehydrogenase [Anaerosphaera multitolerans]
MKEFEKYGKVLKNEPLKKYTSFKTGGPANLILFPESEEDLISALKICKERNLKHIVLGNCTNVLAKDEGFDGVVIMLKGVLKDISVSGDLVTASAGATLREVAEHALEKSLKGLEFAHGIPGSVGGGVIMNAGAYDGELKDVVESVRLLDNDLNIIELDNKEMNFGYRQSIAQEKGYIVLSAKFKLNKGNYEEIKSKMEDLMKRRSDKQPLDMPSAGSTFRRPEGYFAGKLIDDSGLRGFTHGGAGISEKHCGFVVNKNNATSKEIKETIEIVQKVVYDNFNVKLVREVKYI